MNRPGPGYCEFFGTCYSSGIPRVALAFKPCLTLRSVSIGIGTVTQAYTRWYTRILAAQGAAVPLRFAAHGRHDGGGGTLTVAVHLYGFLSEIGMRNSREWVYVLATIPDSFPRSE